MVFSIMAFEIDAAAEKSVIKNPIPAAYIKKTAIPLNMPLDLIDAVTINKKTGKVHPNDAIANPIPYRKYA